MNLRDREAKGIVAPGNEYADVVGEIVDGFTGFEDIETGEPIIGSALAMEALVGEAAPRRDVLPDVMVNWGERPATASIGVRSPRYGELRWERGARFHSGRSGNHLPWGWLVAAGPDIEAGQAGGEFETVDLTPTIFDWLGVPIPDRFVGRAIDQRWSQPTSDHDRRSAQERQVGCHPQAGDGAGRESSSLAPRRVRRMLTVT